ncbi:hypothetical protein CONPUDRAFT_85724, partial [Coniophora puteana RWD-64-598 SS2]
MQQHRRRHQSRPHQIASSWRSVLEPPVCSPIFARKGHRTPDPRTSLIWYLHVDGLFGVIGPPMGWGPGLLGSGPLSKV